MSLSVVDLFSGGGGASAGFAAAGGFRVVGAADAQIGKPSSGHGTLSCNATYAANIGVVPVATDLGRIDPDELATAMDLHGDLDVLIACPPCTGFSRTNALNHIRDDLRNALVPRVADFAAAWDPQVIIMENARELLMGRFRQHLSLLSERLNKLGYQVSASTHYLNHFGLPQRRERTLVIASRKGIINRTITDLWEGYEVDPKATHVRRAIWHLPPLAAGERDSGDLMHVAPRTMSSTTRARISAIPHDGGSWFDLAKDSDHQQLLTPTMERRLSANNIGSHPDVYGRMWWDRPAPTIKRECGHVGNGRYTHPNQDRLCSVREMAILNGFPTTYRFSGSVSNSYRHIGDAVPPLVSYQLAKLVGWMMGNSRPEAENLVMPDTHLVSSDIRRTDATTVV